MQRFTVRPRGPFSLATANRYFGGWPTLAADPTALVMAFPVEGWRGSALVVVRESAPGEIVGEVSADEPQAAWQTALAALSLDVDATQFPAVGERDPVIGRLQQHFDFARPVCFHSPYEAACAFVIGHRLSIAQTRALRARFAGAHGDAMHVDGETFHAFPRPQVLLELDQFGPIAGEKMERLHGIAHAALAGRLDRERLRTMEYELAVADMRTLRGVGAFMSQGIVIRGAALRDEVSNDEVTLQAVQQAYSLDAEPDYATTLRMAEAWRPFRAWCVVLLHLWLRHEGQSFRPAGRSATRRRASP